MALDTRFANGKPTRLEELCLSINRVLDWAHRFTGRVADEETSLRGVDGTELTGHFQLVRGKEGCNVGDELSGCWPLSERDDYGVPP